MEQFQYKQLQEFTSRYQFKRPDESAYEKQKGVEFIKHTIETIDHNPDIVNPKFTEWVGESWNQFHGPMIAAVLSGSIKKDMIYPKTFPGPVIPGPSLTSQFIGSTAWDTFNYMLTIPERVVDVKKIIQIDNHYLYNDDKPKLEFTNIQNLDKWTWKVDQPKLIQMQLTIPETQPSSEILEEKRGQLIIFLNTEVNRFIEDAPSMTSQEFVANTKKLLELVQITQSPYVKNDISDRVVITASEILKSYLCRGETTNFLPAIFQLESSLMYAEALSMRDVIGNGLFHNSWIEVSKTQVEKLRSTEIVDEKRAIDEVVNLITRGWAPIITDESINNTDGSHRGIAVRVWNLLKELNSTNSDFNKRFEIFISNNKDMTGLTLRETLRVTECLLTNDKYKDKLDLILPTLPNRNFIKYIPTILLREQEACCVIKSPFDKEGKVIGVDPYVTHTLTNGRTDLALGSRGPYHRTDRTPAPWFDVFALQ